MYRLNLPVSHMGHQISHTIQIKVHKLHFSHNNLANFCHNIFLLGGGEFWTFDAFCSLIGSPTLNSIFRVKWGEIINFPEFDFFLDWRHSHSHSNFSWAFLSKGERCMRLTLSEAPTRETRPDHNTGNFIPYSFPLENTEDAGDGAYGL